MKKANLKPGSVVKCIQHDLPMTVKRIDENNVYCDWFDEETLCSDVFNIEDLTLIEL